MGNYLDSNGLSYFWSKLKTMFQPKLVSGTNIKTVNNESLLGSGNIAISGGVTVDSALNSTSTNPVENRAIHSALADKLAIADFGDMLDGEIIDRGTGYGLLYLAENDRVLTLDDALSYIGAADVDHTHDASDIVSGTLDAARIPNLAASKITSGTMSALRVHRLYYQGTGGASEVSVASGTITRIPLSGQYSSGDTAMFSLSNGGIKVANAGRYMISASVYITNATGQNGRGCYVCRVANGGTFSSSDQILQALQYSEPKAGAVPCGPKVMQLNANDVIYLAARSTGAATTAGGNGSGTYLLVERLS